MQQQACTGCKDGVGLCTGCQNLFCPRHFSEHRKELDRRMIKVVYEHTELRKALEAPNAMHNILSHIDEWEKKSIEKIKKKAGQARKDLLECIGRTKHELIGSLDTMGAEIKSSQEITTYAENEINQWMKKLEELRRIAEKPQNIEIVNDETPNSSINMITVIEKSNSRVFSTANQIAAQSRSLTTTLGAYENQSSYLQSSNGKSFHCPFSGCSNSKFSPLTHKKCLVTFKLLSCVIQNWCDDNKRTQ
ncbi:unnamed protein product [Rotaria magnacalcarata]|nr:unnamed protein product [Rotaria magnacalcarata]CAF2066815.1 unnamed protein product [Rotaria magnacalcarata]CAF2102158.1 unnamed protein product [Rotaria magnacalcarata]